MIANAPVFERDHRPGARNREAEPRRVVVQLPVGQEHHRNVVERGGQHAFHMAARDTEGHRGRRRDPFEVDGYEPEHGRAWSVVVKGRADNLERFEDLYRAQALPLFPWNAAPKERFVRLRPERLTGRRFTVLGTRTGESPQL